MEELFHYCGGARGDNARRLPPPLSAWTYEHTMDKVNPIDKTNFETIISS